MRLKPERGTGRKEGTYQRGSTDFSERPNDVIQASLSLALPGSSIPDRLEVGEGVRDKETGLEFLSLVQIGGKGRWEWKSRDVG